MKGKHVMATGTLALNDPSPKWGDHISFTAQANVRSSVLVTIWQNGVQIAQSSEEYQPAGTYLKQFGCYAPSWPEGTGADGKAELHDQSGKKPTTITSINFTVAPTP